jgi:hypothetical protein
LPFPLRYRIGFFRVVFLLGIILFAVPALAQNTKGDKSVGNQKKVRETRTKSVKKRESAVTKDIAGRRLRTKNKSSANRNNVGIKQPDPYGGRKRVNDDKPTRSRPPVLSSRPEQGERPWHGDISGFGRSRKVKPRSADAAHHNIYPQRQHATRRPAGDKPFSDHNRTASGKPIVKRVPQHKERAWRGDVRGNPIAKPRSISGQVRNVYPQKNKFSRYVGRHKDTGDRSFANKAEVAKAARMRTDTRPKSWGQNPTAGSASRAFVQRGRKNVYWGKFSKGERAITGDLTGRPLQKRNFRSAPGTLHGRDTLQFFGRHPHGDAAFKGKGRRFITEGRQERGWRGDISGSKFRSRRQGSADVAGRKNIRSISGNVKHGKLQGRAPGFGAKQLARGLRKTGGISKGFADQGESFSGYLKARKPMKGGGTVSGKLWNNNRKAIGGKVLPAGSDRPGAFSGTLRGGKMYADQGETFTGYLKSRKPVKGGGSLSGQLWNNNRKAIQGRVLPAGSDRPGAFSGNMRGGKFYADQGEAFTGFIKARKPLKGGGSISGQLWNNNRKAIQRRVLPTGWDRPGTFSGNMRGGKFYADQGEAFTGYLKSRKPLKGGGSISGQMWNNNKKPIQGRVLPAGSDRPGAFSGNISGGKIYADQGEAFTGYTKAKKQLKGGGSISGKLWNNREQAVTQLNTSNNAIAAGGFQGRKKAGRPEKGGGSVSGKLWNNNNEAVTRLNASSSSVTASRFGGKDKENKRSADAGVGLKGKNRLKKDFTQSPLAVEASTKKARPEATGFRADGLQVRVSRDKFEKRDHSAKGALQGIAPKRSSVRATEFSSGMKARDHKHNPSSDDDALKVLYLGKSFNRTQNYQGTMKARRLHHKGMHPDAAFVNNGENNVKEERSVFTNVKLFWSRLWHKSESQPANIKDKSHQLRYDKGEKGMWAD